MWCNNGSPGNPNNYIWSTYLKRDTLEDKLIRNIAGAAVAALVGWLCWWLWRPKPQKPVARIEQNDLFKDW